MYNKLGVRVMSKIVIVSSSMRIGNSDCLCDCFEKGLSEKKHNITRINLRDINLTFCSGCSFCYDNGRCCQKDDMHEYYQKIQDADILVFATPIYFGAISGQLKVFIDRLYPIYKNLNAKSIIVIATCYQSSKSTIDNSIYDIKRFAEDSGNIKISKIIYGEGTDDPNDVSEEQKNMAYDYAKLLV